MRGSYLDTLERLDGARVVLGPWRANTLVTAAASAIAGLFMADPRVQGGSWLAFGAGEPDWDGALPSPDEDATVLVNEIGRVPVESITYVDDDGEPSEAPTSSIVLTARLSTGQPTVLREFAVFIGAGAERPGGGVMINNVIHPRIELGGGRELVRRVRFDFLPPPGEG